MVGLIFTDLKSRFFVHQRLNCLLLWFMFLFVFSLLNTLFTHCYLNPPAPQFCLWWCPAPISHHPLFVTSDVITVTHLLFSFHDNIRILLSQQRETDSSQSFLLGFSFFFAHLFEYLALSEKQSFPFTLLLFCASKVSISLKIREQKYILWIYLCYFFCSMMTILTLLLMPLDHLPRGKGNNGALT